MSALNAAARNKPQLIRDHLPVLLPILYKETLVNTSLIRTVQMGPWTHKVDDGLEARKTAYETMYTLVCLSLLPRLLNLVYTVLNSQFSSLFPPSPLPDLLKLARYLSFQTRHPRVPRPSRRRSSRRRRRNQSPRAHDALPPLQRRTHRPHPASRRIHAPTRKDDERAGGDEGYRQTRLGTRSRVAAEHT